MVPLQYKNKEMTIKRKLLESQLKDLGCTFVSHSGEHDKWKSKKGNLLWIPRHKDINEYTAKSIIKQASI